MVLLDKPFSPRVPYRTLPRDGIREVIVFSIKRVLTHEWKNFIPMRARKTAPEEDKTLVLGAGLWSRRRRPGRRMRGLFSGCRSPHPDLQAHSPQSSPRTGGRERCPGTRSPSFCCNSIRMWKHRSFFSSMTFRITTYRTATTLIRISQ